MTFDLGLTSKVMLGSDEEVELTLEDREVARRHASVQVDEEDVLRLHDSSRTGTFLNGKLIRTAALEGREEVRLGRGGPLLRITVERVRRERRAGVVEEAAVGGEEVKMPAVDGTPRWWWMAGGVLGAVVLVWLVFPKEVSSARYEAQGSGTAEMEARFAAMADELQRTRQQIQSGMFDLGEATDRVKKDVAERKGDAEVFAEVARKYEKCVALVVGGGGLATAFAVGPSVFATNSHVSKPVAEALARGDDCWLVMNKDGGVRYRILRAVVHADYGVKGANMQVPTNDVGLLYIGDKLSLWLPIADDVVLHQVDAGHPVCYIGFPSEGLQGGNVDVDDPIATMKTGIVTSVSDWELRNGGVAQNFLVRHDMGATGGASGSPILDRRGRVISILNAGNMFHFSDGKSRLRVPNAANINFAQRVDCLRDIWPDYPGKRMVQP